MSDQPKFLETEELIVALLDELDEMKSATQQIDRAGTVTQQVTESAHQLVQWAGQIIEKSSSQLSITQNLGRQVEQNLEKIDQSRSELVQHMQQVLSAQNAETDLIGRLIQLQDDLHARLSAFGETLAEAQKWQQNTFQEQNTLIGQQHTELQTWLTELRTQWTTAQDQQITFLQSHFDNLKDGLEALGSQHNASIQIQKELIQQGQAEANARQTELQTEWSAAQNHQAASLQTHFANLESNLTELYGRQDASMQTQKELLQQVQAETHGQLAELKVQWIAAQDQQTASLQGQFDDLRNKQIEAHQQYQTLFQAQQALIQQNQEQSTTALLTLKAELVESQQSAFQTQAEALRQAQEKILADMAGFQQYLAQFNTTFNVVIVIGLINILMTISLLVLKVIGK